VATDDYHFPKSLTGQLRTIIKLMKETNMKMFPGTSFVRQLSIMLKISFIRKFRAPILWLELILPGMFLVFVCVFASRVSFLSDPIQQPVTDKYVPFTAVAGPMPQYGIIPDNQHTRLLLAALENTAISAPDGVSKSTIFFNSFDEYKSWIQTNRKTKDVFYAIEWCNSNPPNLTHPDILISTNGMTQFPMDDVDVQTVPDFIRAIGSAITAIAESPETPTVFLEWAKLPSDSVFQVNEDNSTEIIIFVTVLFIPVILTAATNYGTEAESGLRDLFIFFGCSLAANRVRWYLECFTTGFVLSIPFAVVIWALVGISFWLLLVTFFLGAGSIVSLTFVLIVIWPTQSMGRVVGLGILMTFFVAFFWAKFSWLYTDDGYYEKWILSILPSASIPYTFGQIIRGHCVDFSNVRHPDNYPVQLGLTYMAVEMVVYYIAFFIIDYIKETNWYISPWKWSKRQPIEDVMPISVDWLRKIYGDIVALNDLSFQVEMGETLAIVGPNGAGKSTLLAILAGALPSTSGQVRFKGLETTRDVECIHRMVGFCPQENLFMNELKVPEWFHALCILRGEPDFDYSQLVAALGLEDQLESLLGDLSGGNKRKVCLATALLGNPTIVVLDEATSGVDFTSRTRIWSLIASLNNTTVIMATHTLEECEKIADRIMVLADGEISALETPTELRQKFKCGYLIETAREHESALRQILTNREIQNPEIEITETQARVVIPAEEHQTLTAVLNDINFPYLMSIQSLEEKIFSHIQEREMTALLNREAAHNTEDEDLHPTV
jgi:ABC-type multidrug transport system ATPase subunit